MAFEFIGRFESDWASQIAADAKDRFLPPSTGAAEAMADVMYGTQGDKRE
jgi:hypothetical protein